MLFNEIYGNYYQVVGEILTEATEGTLTDDRLNQIVLEKAFSEGVLTIPSALKEETWPLLTENMQTPLRHAPKRPLSILEKRWLASLLLDPRIALFAPSKEGLEEVKPLYDPSVFVYFDQYSDGDDYSSPQYIACFRTILEALKTNRKLEIVFTTSRKTHTCVCIPRKLEYSSKDDKFRLLLSSTQNINVINLSKMCSCTLLESISTKKALPEKSDRTETLVLRLTDARDGLKRVLLHFSHFKKETIRLDDVHYLIKLEYSKQDETELVIRVLSFGPILEVLEPFRFREKIKKRLQAQSVFFPEENQ